MLMLFFKCATRGYHSVLFICRFLDIAHGGVDVILKPLL